MALTVNLEEYPDTNALKALQKELLVEHAEFQKRAFWWAMEIIRCVGSLEGAWVDARNQQAVGAARMLVKYYDEEVVGRT